jgi:PKD repeat protein
LRPPETKPRGTSTLAHVFTDFTGDKDIVGPDPSQLDLPKTVGEVYGGVTFHFDGKKCPPLSASATANSPSGPVPAAVQFNGSVTGGCPDATAAYSWDFGDGTTSRVPPTRTRRGKANNRRAELKRM